jgi:hypothetical protein
MPDLSANLWTLPGPNRFIHKAGQQLNDRSNLIIILPTIIDRRGFRQSLLDCLEKELHLFVQVIDLANLNGNSPFESLKEMFPSLKQYKILEQSVQDLSLPNVILIDNLETCSLKNRAEWFMAMNRWSDSSSRCAGEHSLAMIANYQAFDGMKLPGPEVKLVYQVWSGMPSALDVRMLCRLKTERLDAEGQWRENLLASLAGNDLDLAEQLWDSVLVGDEEILKILCKYAKDKGWDPAKENGLLSKWRPKPPGSENPNKLDLEDLHLLRRGITVYTPEYGEEIHSALLALLGRRNDLNHRIWRAQAGLLLPLIDDVRRRVCDHMDHNYGEGWAIVGQEELEPDIELGRLKFIIEGLDRQSWVRRQWESGVNLTWKLRNDLAHYKKIPYHSFCDFWRFYSSVHSILFQLSN